MERILHPKTLLEIALSFCCVCLRSRDTPDEGIVVELQEENVRLEFLFLPDNSAEVSGYVNNDMRFDHPLTETTEYCSLKWLVCPDGNCDNWE